jgi:ketosteroid isomerase-like protein
MVVVLNFCFPLVVRGDDVEDLKATFEQTITALNAGDLNAYLAIVHDQEIRFGPDSPFAGEGKATARQGLQTLLANHESITRTPINPQFRVIGTTGLAWGHVAVNFKPKDGPLHTTFTCYLWTYVKVEGKWLLVASHISGIPTGN